MANRNCDCIECRTFSGDYAATGFTNVLLNFVMHQCRIQMTFCGTDVIYKVVDRHGRDIAKRPGHKRGVPVFSKYISVNILLCQVIMFC